MTTSREAVSEQPAYGMGERDGDKPLGLSFSQATQKMASSHARVDQNGDDTSLKESENKGNKIDSRPHKQHQPCLRLDPHRLQASGNPIGIVLQFSKCHLSIPTASVGFTTHRFHDGDASRVPHGCFRKPPAHVDGKSVRLRAIGE